MYENGSFRKRSYCNGGDLTVTDNRLDLRPNSPNRAVIDFLLSKKVKIEWQKGNTIE